jgi:hypothetical protein
MSLTKRQLEYQRKWRASTPDKQAKYNLATRLRMRAYYKSPEGKAMHAKYVKEHPELYAKARKKQTERIKKQEPWRWKHYQAKFRCRNKCLNYRRVGIKYKLTLDQIKTLWFRDKAYLLRQPSIDRINTTGNYTFENTRFIELSDNLKRAKGKYHEQADL